VSGNEEHRWIEILGAGGHASVVAHVAHRARTGRVRVWYERTPDPRRFPDGTVFQPISKLAIETTVLLGMGDIQSRKEWRARFPGIAHPLVDPSAIIGHGVRLAPGVIAMPAVVVNPNALVGEDAILNTGSIIEHDCQIGRNTHISPGALLGGAARVGSDSLVGTGAVLLPGVDLGNDVIVGAGAAVVVDVSSGSTVVGVPARSTSH
jgi:sugar O-acyltransferase (sialic acid O-acetyltransferase NeuD family)